MPVSYNNNMHGDAMLTTMTQLIILPLVHACWLINAHPETLKVAVVCLISEVKRVATFDYPFCHPFNGIHYKRVVTAVSLQYVRGNCFHWKRSFTYS